MKLETMLLLELMPKFMRTDETTIALCKAIEPELKLFYRAKGNSMVLPIIDTAPEWMLDELAWEQRLSWYDTSAPIETKRKIIKSGKFVKKHLGTVAAVERTIQDYFGDGQVEEWFDYAGEPFFFRVRTTNPEVTDEQAKRFVMALNATKNARSHLEAVVVDRRAEMIEWAAITYHEGETLNITIGGL